MMLAFLGYKGDVNGLAGIQGGKKSLLRHTHTFRFSVKFVNGFWMLLALNRLFLQAFVMPLGK